MAWAGGLIVIILVYFPMLEGKKREDGCGHVWRKALLRTFIFFFELPS